MWRRAALNHLWVRAAILAAAFAVVVSGLYLLGATLLEDGYRFLGWAVLDVEMGLVLVAVFIGPAWVLGPSTGTPGGGPPRGGILPFPGRTPELPDRATDDDLPRAA